MTYPANLSVITVTGRFLDGEEEDAGPASGTVVFTSTAPLLQGPTAETFLRTVKRTVELDSNGEFSVELPASDDPQWVPQGYEYQVDVKLDGGFKRMWRVSVPYDAAGETVDLATLAPNANPGPAKTLVLATDVGKAGGVASLDEDGQVPLGQLPSDVVIGSEMTGALLGKQDTLPSGSAVQFLRGSDKTFVSLNKSLVGLPNVDDTSDVSKPVSTAQAVAIGTRVPKDQVPVNPKDFGAVGDGTADDTTALGQALYTASQSGRHVLLPPGTYKYTALSLTAPLHGAGRGRTVLQGPAVQMNFSNVSLRDVSVVGTQSVLVNSANASKLEISGCDFSHDAGLGITNHLAVAWSNVTDGQIKNSKFGIGGVQFLNVGNYLVDGNFWDAQFLNINEPFHASQKSSGQFVNNTVTRTSTDAVDLYSSGEYCVVANNRFIGLGGNAGMELKITLSDDSGNSSAAGNIIDGVVVTGNVFRDFRGPTTNARAGIFAEYVDSRAVKSFNHTLTARALVISDNILEDFEPVSPGAIVSNWVGIAFTGHNCRITGNVIRNMRSWNSSVNYGIRLALYGAGVADGVKCTGVAVIGNTIAGIDGNGSAGIATGSLEQCQITDNIIRGDEPAGTITKWGLDVGTGAVLTDTRISGNLFHCNNATSIGLRVVGAGSKLSKCQLVGNVFRDCHWAINVAEHTIFANNTVDNALNSQAPYVGLAGTPSVGNLYSGNHITMSADHALVLTDHDQFTVDACVFRDTFSGVLLVGATRNGIVNGCVSIGQSNTTFPTYSGVSAPDQASISVGINRVNSASTNLKVPVTGVSKTDVGLANVANLAPADLPVSTAQAAADALKTDKKLDVGSLQRYNDVFQWYQSGSSIAGSIVVRTGLVLGTPPSMVGMSIVLDQLNGNVLEGELNFYSFNSTGPGGTPGFAYLPAWVYTSTQDVGVRLAKDSGGKLCIILDKATAWAHPGLRIREVRVRFNAQADSVLAGWSASAMDSAAITTEFGTEISLPATQRNLYTALDAKLALAGGTLTGKVVTPASTTASAPLRLPQGVAPTAPLSGDIWTTSNGVYAQVNGVTKTLVSDLRYASALDFGFVGDNFTDNIAAFVAMMTHINSVGGNLCITFPEGEYKIGAAVGVPNLTVSNVRLRGVGPDSSNLRLTSGVYFNLVGVPGSPVSDFTMDDISIYYAVPDTTNPTLRGKISAWHTFNNVKFVGGATFAELGGTLLADWSYNLRLRGCSVRIANVGKPFIRLLGGAGLYWDTFDNVGHMTSSAPVFDRVSVMTTLPGTNAVDIVGHWDTVEMAVFAEKLYRVLNIEGDGTILFNIRLKDSVCDYIRDSVVYADLGGAAYSSLHTMSISNVYGVTWEGPAFYFRSKANANISSISMNNVYTPFTGKQAVHFDVDGGPGMRKFVITGCKFIGTGRMDDAYPAVEIDSVEQLVMNGNRIGGNDLTANVPWGVDRGLKLGAVTGEYNISGNVSDEYNIPVPTTPVGGSSSKKRRVVNNVFGGTGAAANYAGIKSSAPYTKPATDTDWYNVSPYDVAVFVGGSSITAVKLDGVTLPFLQGSFVLEPGHYYSITYTDGANANVVYNVKQ